MDKIFLTAAASIGALFGVGGDHGKPPPPDRFEAKVHASSTTKLSFDISCVAAAVAAREAALDAGIATNGQDVNAAYTARASALASAYAQTGNDSIKKAVKSSWATFGAALRLAHKNWQRAQQGAWSQFKTALKACGTGAAAVSDSSNASVDANAGGGTN